MRGRKPKPTHLKLVTGNPGKRKLNASEPMPAPALPEPPFHLGEEARTEWKRVAEDLYRLGVLTEIDRVVLAAYCQAYGRWVRAELTLSEMAKRDELTGGLMVRTISGNRSRTLWSELPTRRWRTWCAMRPNSA
jgi:phage terminase small subunit